MSLKLHTGFWRTGTRSHEYGRLCAEYGQDSGGAIRVTAVLTGVMGELLAEGQMHGDLAEIFPELRDVIRRAGASGRPGSYMSEAEYLHGKYRQATHDSRGICKADWSRAYLRHCIPLNSNDRYHLVRSLDMGWLDSADLLKGRINDLHVDFLTVVDSFPTVAALTYGSELIRERKDAAQVTL